MDENLRAEDFRRAWPTALSVAMGQVIELTQKIEEAAEKVETANNNAVIIAELIPVMIKELQSVVKTESDKLLDGSRVELSQIREEVKNLLAQASDAQNKMLERAASLEKQAAIIAKQREILRIENEKRNKKWFHFFR